MKVGLALAALAFAGALCAMFGALAPAVWLITAALTGYALLLAYGFWDAFIKRH